MTRRETIDFLARTKAFCDDAGRTDREARVMTSAQLRVAIHRLTDRLPKAGERSEVAEDLVETEDVSAGGPEF